ncbi:MAG: hypothetical protein H7X71_06150 [Chitinophagales bacterium]|nr:hypothetical protein [Chitinophagales bacterium]
MKMIKMTGCFIAAALCCSICMSCAGNKNEEGYADDQIENGVDNTEART